MFNWSAANQCNGRAVLALKRYFIWLHNEIWFLLQSLYSNYNYTLEKERCVTATVDQPIHDFRG